MSKTKNKRWSRLLFTLLIVVALGLSMVPAAVFAAPGDECRPSECGLQVTIINPAPGTQVPVGQCFWVNAAVARSYGTDPSNEVTGVQATLYIDAGNAEITPCGGGEPVAFEVQYGANLTNANEIDDFWWKVCCTGVEDVSLRVEAVGTSDNCGAMTAVDTRTVIQINPVCDPCLVIDIIECGPEDVQGNPLPAYPNETVYAVKATITNVCDAMVCGVDAMISWTPQGSAELLSGSPVIDDVDCIFPGRSEEVSWTFICRSGDDATFKVDAVCEPPCLPEPPEYCPDPCTPEQEPGYCDDKCVVQYDTCVVNQVCPAALKVSLLPLPDKVCVDCSSEFVVTAEVCESCGETGVNDVEAHINITSGNANATLLDPIDQTVYSSNVTKPNCDDLDPGECGQLVSWRIDVIGPGDINIEVTADGYDAYKTNLPVVSNTAKATVEGRDNLMVEITGPADNEVYNVCENYNLEFKVTNCSDSAASNVYVVVDLSAAENVTFVGTTATAVSCGTCDTTIPPLTLTEPRAGMMAFTIPVIGSCCCVDVTIPLVCTGSGVDDCNIAGIADELINVMVYPGAGQQPADNDTVIVHQMYKAHLTSTLAVYEGLLTDETFEGCEPICAVVQGEYYTVVAVVANQGEATAQDVQVMLAWQGNAILSGDTPELQTISEIGCHQAAKVMWQFQCSGEGKVTFDICGLTGIDANTGVAIHADNIVMPVCNIVLEQIPLEVEIIQPVTSTDFIELESFSVKAKVTNTSTMYSLKNVNLTLRWFTEEPGCDPCAGDFTLSSNNPVNVTPTTPTPDTLVPGEIAFATWQVRCCGAGDVSFWIDVDAQTVKDNALTIPGDCCIDISSNVNTIHQWEKGGIICYILSPHLKDYDVCHEYGDPEAYIATGQEFSVTAKLVNTGDLPFMVNSVELSTDGWMWNGDISYTPDFTLPITLAPFGSLGDSQVVSFDVVCTDAGKTDILMQATGVSLPPDQTPGVADSCMSFVCIEQYEAAHLVVNITSSYPDPIDLGSEFEITAIVTNIGEADAWDVSAIISVFPATSAEVSYNDQYGSYTRDLGNLTGHELNESEEVTWLMRCKAICDTTITVTAIGYDESGFEVKQICTSEIKHDKQVTCCDLLLDGTPGAPIQSRFIEPASITVKQQDPSDPDPDPEDPVTSGNHDIDLYAGWNLISSPWYVLPADRDPNILLADILDDLYAAYGYMACGGGAWTTFIPSVQNTLGQMRDGNGYWLLMNEPATLAIIGSLFPPGNATPPTYNVCTGWNLIGFKNGEAPKAATSYLGANSYGPIYGFDAETQLYFQVQPTDMLQPGYGYWVAFYAAGTIYP